MTPGFIRGLAAEDQFRKLLGDRFIKSTAMEDRLDHWDFQIKVDVKKVRSVDPHGESDYHWVEIRSVGGEDGWLYGKSDFIAFETKNMWIMVPTEALRDYVKVNIKREFTTSKEPYKYYRREGRKDLLMRMPTLDLFRIDGSFKIHKP